MAEQFENIWRLMNRAFGVFLSLVVLITIVWLGVCFLDRSPPQSDRVGWPLNAEVKVGEPLLIRWNYKRHYLAEQKADAYIIDGAGVRWNIASAGWRTMSDEIGTQEDVIRRIIPIGATPGPARYRLVFTFARPGNPVHLIWPIVEVVDDVAFTIVP